MGKKIKVVKDYFSISVLLPVTVLEQAERNAKKLGWSLDDYVEFLLRKDIIQWVLGGDDK